LVLSDFLIQAVQIVQAVQAVRSRYGTRLKSKDSAEKSVLKPNNAQNFPELV
jgi:hypothetical protein